VGLHGKCLAAVMERSLALARWDTSYVASISWEMQIVEERPHNRRKLASVLIDPIVDAMAVSIAVSDGAVVQAPRAVSKRLIRAFL
jgi:hypothetical protein